MHTSSDNPTCYHRALDHFSKLTGISRKKELVFDSIDQLRSKPHKHMVNKNSFKSVLLYPSSAIRVVTECGKTVSYMQGNNKRFDSIGYIAKQFIVDVNRNIDEFGLEYQELGKYKDSLGGGWHQTIALYRYQDFYFCKQMECSC